MTQRVHLRKATNNSSASFNFDDWKPFLYFQKMDEHAIAFFSRTFFFPSCFAIGIFRIFKMECFVVIGIIDLKLLMLEFPFFRLKNQQ